ncbi:hypothetical protein O9G_002221 [Rozella allomycis CSF55]|uniref:Uncharacterized protein n=1 Tax=Rozella allomycis (strain CSF55) TaxID=988480 RepID=A0A075AQ60_ROZAC|nr:hypothetical protein O9G_002221 [Rozella allomycis CSF55]|eukprot:EPZ32381.1 hypothetical protein O9G_002221 [Rozella allomycis CSF55]
MVMEASEKVVRADSRIDACKWYMFESLKRGGYFYPDPLCNRNFVVPFSKFVSANVCANHVANLFCCSLPNFVTFE